MGDQQQDHFGYVICLADRIFGDADGRPRPGLVVTATKYDEAGELDTGRVYVFKLPAAVGGVTPAPRLS